MKKAKFALFAALSLTIGFSAVSSEALAAKVEISNTKTNSEIKTTLDNYFKERENSINNGDITSLPFDKNDETYIYFKYIREVDNFEISDYRISYDIKKITENENDIEVDIYLTQEFVINGSIDSGFADDVTITLKKSSTVGKRASYSASESSENLMIEKMSSETLETDSSSDDVIKKGKK
ncbi:hypothetical protein [Brevibacillus brevis]|uniref:NEAT domain-containing protein n=1 Tax=Brevibacillus brevis TaxID=1393 RepID=A0ABY9SZ32_BREBE|nr:hypothetical protein [Brevibacillus brevis]WNC12276.1 hypothetical protein RGB73_16165 [Brevibacillus brevis]